MWMEAYYERKVLLLQAVMFNQQGWRNCPLYRAFFPQAPASKCGLSSFGA
jgi:hypothetical protein